MNPTYTLSIVSHGQGALIQHLLADIRHLTPVDFEVIVTLNLPEDETPYAAEGACPLRIIRNATPRGFGANHNAAFTASRGDYFVVMNPDIRLASFQLGELRQAFEDRRVGICAPVVLNTQSEVEDSARRFPTLGRLLRRVVLRQRAPDYTWEQAPVSVDWVAGMLMMVRRDRFEAVGGFDARRFFMYFEDVDLCERMRRHGWEVHLLPTVAVVHDAQRASHRSLKHLRWHLTSAVRYLTGM